MQALASSLNLKISINKLATAGDAISEQSIYEEFVDSISEIYQVENLLKTTDFVDECDQTFTYLKSYIEIDEDEDEGFSEDESEDEPVTYKYIRYNIVLTPKH